MNRRLLLRASAGTVLLGGLPLALAPTAGRADFGDYRALVCVFLFGGNDGFNLLVPRSDAEYNAYAASRQNMAVPQADLLPINPITSDGAEYGLHPSMAGVQDLFETGNAALVANIGPLLEPTTKTDYLNKSVDLPPQLFSHNDQQAQWHSLKGRLPGNTGWAGRMVDILAGESPNQLIPPGASLFGTSLFLAGADSVPYVMGPNGPIPFSGFGDDGLLLEQRLAFERIVGAQYASIYERGFAEVQQRAIANADLVNGAIANAPELTTEFPASILGTQLQTVARLIAVRDDLQMERQVFFVAYGGFDTHDDQVELQPGLLGSVSEALSAFHAATAELGVDQEVTAFTQSDFGRTLTSNGDGTDHAWGSVQVVTGGSVLGQELYGTFPVLEIGGDDDVGGGRMIPTTSADQFAATFARWMGVASDDIATIAPHVDRFAVQDLGFLT